MEENKWLAIFVQKPIIAVLAKYLRIEDWFSLSATCVFMYLDWITRDAVAAIDMRKLVFERFKWKYAKANPFKWVRKNALASRFPNNGKRVETFRCMGGCGKTLKWTKLISSKLSRVTVCVFCYCGGSCDDDPYFNTTENMLYTKFDASNQLLEHASKRHVEVLSEFLGTDTNLQYLGWSFLNLLGEIQLSNKKIDERYYTKDNAIQVYAYTQNGNNVWYVAENTIDKNVLNDVIAYDLIPKFAHWIEENPSLVADVLKRRKLR